MLDLLSTFTNTNGLGFPDTGAINSSGGAATDGTEFIAAMINDQIWGWLQALLDYTGQTPNGITEAPGASQFLEGLRRLTIPGLILPAVWNDDPATLGIRAIMLTGQGILRANYTELDSIIYVGDGNNATATAFYHADDAAGVTRNTTGVYLILPDARGQVVRGLDLTGSIDPDGASRELGDLQGSAMWGHHHQAYDTVAAGSLTAIANQSSRVSVKDPQDLSNGAVEPIDDGVHGTPFLDSESRMTNLAANLMITF